MYASKPLGRIFQRIIKNTPFSNIGEMKCDDPNISNIIMYLCMNSRADLRHIWQHRWLQYNKVGE